MKRKGRKEEKFINILKGLWGSTAVRSDWEPPPDIVPPLTLPSQQGMYIHMQ
jgi:hypothetical protein